MSKINFNKLIGGDVILLNSSFPPLFKFRWTTIEEMYMRLIECGFPSHLTIEKLTIIIITQNKDEFLLEKKSFPHKSEKICLQTTRKPRCRKRSNQAKNEK